MWRTVMLSKCIDLKLTGSLQQTVAQQLWEMIGVDVKGPFPRNINQNVYLLVCVDYFSQWVELFLLRKATADSGERDMTHWACLILSKRGTQFVPSVFQTVTNLESGPQINVCVSFSDQPHRKSQSYFKNHKRLRRWNQTWTALGIYSRVPGCSKSDVQKSTGVSSAELNLQRPLRGPLDLLLQLQDVTPGKCQDLTAGRSVWPCVKKTELCTSLTKT